MIKVRALEQFTCYARFNNFKNLERTNANFKDEGRIYKDDTFECEDNDARYLLNELDIDGNEGHNPINRAVVKVIELTPEEKPVKEEKKTTKKKTTTKKK